MNIIEIKNDINFEIILLDKIVSDTNRLLLIVSETDADIFQISAAALFLAQYYNGIENILKRISKYKKVTLPYGDQSHIELFKWFCYPATEGLPILFSEDIKEGFSTLRRFRHYVFHGYAFYLEWEKLKVGMQNLENLQIIFKKNLDQFLSSL